MSKSMSLEGAMKRLEEIAAQMNTDISIDESINLYAEAVKLIKFANDKLASAKLRIEKLTAQTAEKEESDEQF